MQKINKIFYIYHIPDLNDPTNINSGYIGCTSDIKNRFDFHAISDTRVGKNIRSQSLKLIDVKILYVFDDEDLAYKKELELRPIPDIGWNIEQGGNWRYPGVERSMYSRAKQSETRKMAPINSFRLTDDNYKKISEKQQGKIRRKFNCSFCGKTVSEGNISRWHNANCKSAPAQKEFINGFDIDGVIDMGNYGGVYPGPNDIIITGRSIEEFPETRKMLDSKKIYNKLFMNPVSFEEKTRKSSGTHKANTIIELFLSGITIKLFFEDDWIQKKEEEKILKHFGIATKIIWVNHNNLVEKENVRHIL